MGRGGQGRPSKPTQLKVLHGDRKDRINDAEPVPSAVVTPPSWLDDEALGVWRQYAPDLEATKVLTGWDVEAFALWCDAVVRRRRAVAELAVSREVLEVPVTAGGEVVGYRQVKNSWCTVLAEASSEILRYGARFGLTPSDRSQLKVGEARRDPTEDLLSGC